MMLKVLAGGLNSMDNIGGGKTLAMKSGHANQKSLGQSKLSGQKRIFAGHRERRTGARLFPPEGKPTAENSVDQVILQYLRMALKERGIEAVVGGGEILGKRSEEHTSELQSP